ncbi:hypothetical protein BDV32DRAFT_128614 [Aspergillus pseudonomiae]|uniref:Uncharacterized protein n=1 Tax=Aspergillus pseudonomiae TaxID=1506151 RepID=A0A5N7D2Q3_9EURO|nr:uncharacterized protein BDV37DRAFT_257094 [Aspergillus pseudonomiae]KAB8256742.1 hypothetical protein BDV32DRAFT_128614 [Aspergillus pseudonomiae]KAE8400654.1 hypothetical protein BDV37DRAFT_257094 [Aspergillus pseudonomiae]
MVINFCSHSQKRATQPLVALFISTRAVYARFLVLSVASADCDWMISGKYLPP